MLEDYRTVVDTHEVFVGEFGQRVVGVLVLVETSDGFLLENVAVDPNHQGRGIGRQLLALAEARAIEAGYNSIYLYTNEAMAENLKLYAKLGYEEFTRRREKGLSRVYMRKRLTAAAV
jgi:ribosomal protein S18 acetylase RimI-like enzyme